MIEQKYVREITIQVCVFALKKSPYNNLVETRKWIDKEDLTHEWAKQTWQLWIPSAIHAIFTTCKDLCYLGEQM